MKPSLPSLTEAKAQAKTLRQTRAAEGHTLSHAQALEIIAHRYGFRDWNTLRASIGSGPPQAWAPGGRVKGAYLSHPFEATVVSAIEQQPGWYRLALDLDVPVDVVKFESFSNFRKRVTCVVGPSGRTREKTSDGTPHVVLEM